MVKVGLFGAGVVGRGVVELVRTQKDRIRQTLGADLEVSGIYVRDTSRPRTDQPELETTDQARVLESADIVVEVMGGIEPARSIIQAAHAAGKPVVSANKMLLSNHLGEFSGPLRYEAAVAAAIPILSSLREGFGAIRATRFEAILNGTTNLILGLMSEGMDYNAALQVAQDKGFAEADPSSDVLGHDSLYKAVLLTHALTGEMPNWSMDAAAGITGVTLDHIRAAEAEGKVVKLIASGDIAASRVSVKPQAVPKEAWVRIQGGRNRISIITDVAGELVWEGPGAGSHETASAVLGDAISLGRTLVLS
ncbi:MAG: homoserine dehydrogenase [Armatimonadetes bacterium]|nr:homoserine dehydrogenase [Armatimonadota bacterium]